MTSTPHPTAVHRRLSKDRVLQLLTVALALAVLAAGSVYVVRKHLWAQAKIEEITPRYERLLGVLESEAAMRQASQRSAQLLQAYAYPASQEAGQIGTDVQQKLRTVFNSAQMVIQSSQVLPEEEDGALLAVPVEVRLEGTLEGLRQALAALADQRPLVQVHSFSIQRGHKSNQYDPVRLRILARFFVWRQKP